MSLIEEFSPLSEMKMDISEESSLNTLSPDVGKDPCSPAQSDFEAEAKTENMTLDNSRMLLISVNSHPLMSPKKRTTSDGSKTRRRSESDEEETFTFTETNKTKNELNKSKSPLKTGLRMNKKEENAASSDSEPDLSQYQATVEPSFQSVSLLSNNNLLRTKSNSFTNIESNSSKNGMETNTNISGNNSSLESLSNRSFDELDGLEHQRIFLSRSSSASFADDEIRKRVDAIPEYSASEEARNLRSWQKVTLADGKTREIDMKVIEPYKRVLSHGGYLKENGQNAIVIFSACFLPDRSRFDYHYVMESLFLYVLKTLEQLVTDDYVILYLHGGSSRNNCPSLPWLKKCYQLLDRRLRKSLKNLYLVHPTFWLKSVVWMSRPFISTKFWRKLVYVKNLEEIYGLVPSLEKAAIPEKVKTYDTAFCK